MSDERRPDDRRALLNSALQKLEQMQSRLKAVEGSQKEPIAIIGMGCRFPGGANNPDQFWELLRNGVDAVREIPADRWKIDDYYDADPEAPGKMYTRFGGFLDQIDRFDPQFFGISPREAVTLDPQQRLVLEVGWEALENAGYGALPKLRGSRTGVFIGVGSSDYAQLQMGGGVGQIDAYTGSGGGLCFAAGRFSYCFGLQGPSLSVDTACSSSLVAVHLACQSLRSAECRMAVAGGVNVIVKPDLFVYLSKVKALAPDGRCKVFDAKADGFVRGEGCGMIVLKRLSDAIADGDNILATILGSAVNQDGASTGLTVPNGPAQHAVIAEALTRSGIAASDMDYLEAHGTGTSLGDPIEIGAVVSALGPGRTSDRALTIASVKTNVGHLEAAAGIAGLIKVVLALGHSEIPAHLHYKSPNPSISFGSLPFVIPQKRQPWPAGTRSRIAGVSSFGLSGTNSHIVLAEAPTPKIPVSAVERPMHILALSARTPESLKEICGNFTRFFETHPSVLPGDVCFTANTGRSHFGQRLAIVEPTIEKMRERLADFLHDHDSNDRHSDDRSGDRSRVAAGSVELSRKPRIAFLFPGEGAQFAGVGKQLYETQPTFRRAVDRVAELFTEEFLPDGNLRGESKQPLLDVLFPESQIERSTGRNGESSDKPAYSQPALFALEYALCELWRSWGIEPAVVVGQGVGEYAAACAAGVLTVEAAVKLVAAYEGAMKSLPDGEPNAFDRVARALQSSAPKLPWLSSVTGEQVSGGIDANYWIRHLREPMKTHAAFALLQGRDMDLGIEIGPGTTMIDAVRKYGIGKPVWVRSVSKHGDDWTEILTSLGTLYTHGAAVDWEGVDRDYSRKRVALPTYPFQRQRYWSEPERSTVAGARTAGAIQPTGMRELRSPLIQDRVFETEIGADSYPLLHVSNGKSENGQQSSHLIVVPPAAFLGMVQNASRQAFGVGAHALEKIVVGEPLQFAQSERRVVQIVIGKMTVGSDDLYPFRIFSQNVSRSEDWTLHASGNVRPRFSRAMLAGLSTEEVERSIVEYLSQTVASVLSLPPDSIEPNQRLAELGLDSLTALELRNRLELDLETVLPMARLLSNLSVHELAGVVTVTMTSTDAGKAADQSGTAVVPMPDIEEGEL